MERSKEILNELQTISPALAELEKTNVFQVPDGYFTDLEKRISTLAFLHQDEKNKDLHVPKGYFDELSSKILSKIKSAETDNAQEEISIISPALHYLKKENVFTVPEHYFDNLSNKISEKLTHKNAKVISLSVRRKWWKYAAAAVVASAIAIGSLQIYNNSTTTNNGSTTIIASTNTPNYVQLASEYKTPDQLDSGIASLTDDEIASYLEKHGSILDEGALTKDIDTTELPSTDDYLIDENTLNNFLNTIDAQRSNKNAQ